jgi:3-hydroxy-9,10-secoandrosta-1,3,5(10)-triene-9,17-dione monooxygenase
MAKGCPMADSKALNLQFDDDCQTNLAHGLRARAAELVPILQEREAATNAARKALPETIADFEKAGFFRILQPKKYGGYELPIDVYCDIARTLAQGCMSSAWVYGVIAVHNWQMALFDDRAAQDVWGQDMSVRISSSYMPVGKVEIVDGGYRLRGRWAFSSGSDHCDWVILGAVVPPSGEGSKPEPRNFLVPRSDYDVVDNWDVMGLCGTGSNDIVVEDAFVPAHRTIREQDMFELSCPGHAVHKAALYKMPFAQLFNRTVSMTSIGALRRAATTFIDATREKRATYTGDRLARDTTIQQVVAEVERTLDEIDLVVARDATELTDRAARGDWPMKRRAELGLSTTSIVSRCVMEIDKLMTFSGGKAIYRGNLVQRAFLDIHCARAHVANNPYPYARNLGAVYFGFENECLDI